MSLQNTKEHVLFFSSMQPCLLVFLGQDHMSNVSQAIQVARQANIKVQCSINNVALLPV